MNTLLEISGSLQREQQSDGQFLSHKLLASVVVYLLIRFRSCFNYWLSIILLLVSGLTMFMAGLGANFEFDLKRIIALSTLRQLGLSDSFHFVGSLTISYSERVT